MLAPEFEQLDSWMRKLPDYFSDNGETIFKSRNEVKIFDEGELKLNVKSFKVPNWVNRFVYVYLRGSKAERSFKYALKFMNHNVSTPEPVGFLECLSNGLLLKSYYISMHCSYDYTLREVLNYQVADRDVILRQWIRFTYEKLHLNNIYHLDYSPGNTLINKRGEMYEFSVIDLNRMNFCRIDFENGLKSFRQLDTNLETIELIASEYAALWGKDPVSSVELLKKYHQNNVESRRFRANFKKAIHSFFRFGRAA